MEQKAIAEVCQAQSVAFCLRFSTINSITTNSSSEYATDGFSISLSNTTYRYLLGFYITSRYTKVSTTTTSSDTIRSMS